MAAQIAGGPSDPVTHSPPSFYRLVTSAAVSVIANRKNEEYDDIPSGRNDGRGAGAARHEWRSWASAGNEPDCPRRYLLEVCRCGLGPDDGAGPSSRAAFFGGRRALRATRPRRREETPRVAQNTRRRSRGTAADRGPRFDDLEHEVRGRRLGVGERCRSLRRRSTPIGTTVCRPVDCGASAKRTGAGRRQRLPIRSKSGDGTLGHRPPSRCAIPAADDLAGGSRCGGARSAGGHQAVRARHDVRLSPRCTGEDGIPFSTARRAKPRRRARLWSSSVCGRQDDSGARSILS